MFLSESWLVKTIILIIFALVVYLFIQNIRIDRKLHFFIFHLIVLAFFVNIFIQKDNNNYGYDETSIFLSIQASTLAEPKELLAIAQFGDSRYGLARLQDGSLIISKFEKKRNKYVLKGNSIQDGDIVDIRDNGKSLTSYAIGVEPNSAKIDQIHIKVGMEEIREINIAPNYAAIYHIDIPNNIEGWGVEYRERDE